MCQLTCGFGSDNSTDLPDKIKLNISVKLKGFNDFNQPQKWIQPNIMPNLKVFNEPEIHEIIKLKKI